MPSRRFWVVVGQIASALLFAQVMLGCTTAPAPTAIPPTLTAVATSTPLPPVDDGVYDELPASIDADGFPTLGATDAPVTLTLFGSYDSRATRIAHEDIITDMLPRVQDGEMRIVYVPLSGTGTGDNGRNAALAALCAGEQGAFWPYHDRLFALGRMMGDSAHTDTNLIATADALALDRAAWDACLSEDRAAPVLERASERVINTESYSGTPTILLNGRYVLNDRYSIHNITEQMLQQVNDAGEVMPFEVAVTPADPAETLILPPVASQSVGQPIDITLAEGWALTANDTLLVPDIDAVRTVPFVMYEGPLGEAHTGTIALLWGFPNITVGDLMAAQMGLSTPTPDLWMDGLRLLRLAVIEDGCNIGTDTRRDYAIAGGSGAGTEWAAVNCPELADTRGWFVGTQQFGLNYLFYAYVEPIDPRGVTESEGLAREQLQTMLNSVEFRELSAVAGE